MATLADASELPGTVTVAQVNYSTVTDGEVMVMTRAFPCCVFYSGTCFHIFECFLNIIDDAFKAPAYTNSETLYPPCFYTPCIPSNTPPFVFFCGGRIRAGRRCRAAR